MEKATRKRLEHFIFKLLERLPYQQVKDDAVDVLVSDDTQFPEALRPAVADIMHWLVDRDPNWLPDPYNLLNASSSDSNG
jgi:hypothetical protein